MLPLRILAIEDDTDTREMYRRMLGDEGHDAILAADGVEGCSSSTRSRTS